MSPSEFYRQLGAQKPGQRITLAEVGVYTLNKDDKITRASSSSTTVSTDRSSAERKQP